MEQKACPDCGLTKPVNEFYRNKRMADGRYRTCILCARKYNHTYYDRNPEWFADARKRWNSVPGVKERYVGYNQKYRLMYPEKYKARTAVFNAVATGKLERKPCEVCGATAQGHHEDYSKPLDVRWLCRKHHDELHRRSRESLGVS